jgi:hypothetical protein
VVQRYVDDHLDTVSVSIGDLPAVVHTPTPHRPRRWRTVLAVVGAVAVLVGSVFIVRAVLTDDAPDRVAVAAGVVPPEPLTVHVTAAAESVVYGESVELQFNWRDGDGSLIDVNHVESTAVQYRRDVACDKSVPRPHTVADQGTWTYTPDAMNFGPPPTEPRVVQVGLEVRTGGCAETERVVEQLAITVLPPA